MRSRVAVVLLTVALLAIGIAGGDALQLSLTEVRTVDPQTRTPFRDTSLAVVSPEMAGTSPADTDATSAADPASRRTAERVIREYFPNASQAEVAIWADEFSGFGSDELRFVLEQKQSAGSGVGSLLSTDSFPALSASFSASPTDIAKSETNPDTSGLTNSRNAETRQWLRTAIFVTTTNLQNADVPGYRSTRVLGESGATVTVFDPGPSVTTLNPLHVALPPDAGLMFRLQPGNVLTRRGDFCLLADRTPGLRLGATELSAAGVQPLPIEASRIRISATGEVLWNSEDGQEHHAGRIEIVRWSNNGLAVTQDGVCFTVTDADQVVAADPTTLSLRTGCFELSNVSRADEWNRLEHFERLDSELLSGQE